MHRGAAIVAGIIVAGAAITLTGCTGESGPDPSATSDVQTPRTIATPSSRPTVSHTPEATATAGGVDPVIQHVYDVCAPHAASDSGAVLAAPTPTSPTQADLIDSDGLTSVTFAVSSFADGHTDQYAIYICSVSNRTTTSTFVSGGMSDTH